MSTSDLDDQTRICAQEIEFHSAGAIEPDWEIGVQRWRRPEAGPFLNHPVTPSCPRADWKEATSKMSKAHQPRVVPRKFSICFVTTSTNSFSGGRRDLVV